MNGCFIVEDDAVAMETPIRWLYQSQVSGDEWMSGRARLCIVFLSVVCRLQSLL